jgi:hypothetical protein
MAFWKTALDTQRLSPIKLNGGIRTDVSKLDIPSNQASYNRNVSGNVIDALSVRAGRADSGLTDITTPNALGQRNNADVHVQDGTVWKYWDGAAWQNVQTGLTSATGKFLEFSTGTDKYTILVNGTDKYAWSGAVVTDLTNAPAVKLMTSHKGRLYAGRDNDIQFSALNLINDWSATGDDGAGTIDVTDAKGPLTSIVTYQDMVTCFTEFSMHVLYGTGPNSYRLVDISRSDGCVSDRSVIEGPSPDSSEGVLYWMDRDGIKAYSGGLPRKISEPVQEYIDDINFTHKAKISAGRHEEYIFWSIPYDTGTTNNLILEYNTRTGEWFVHTGDILEFETIGKTTYAVNTSGEILIMNSGTDDDGTAITWSHITGAWFFNKLAQRKTLRQLYVLCDLPVSSTLTVSYSTTLDGDDFVTLKTFTASASVQNVEINVPTTALQNIDYFRLQFAGTGPCTIYCIEPEINIKRR